MTNPYYNFTTPFIPGNKVRSGPINNELNAIVAGFSLLPTDPNAPTHGTTTLGVESGSGNAYAVAMPNTRVSNSDGDEVVFKATHANTGPATIAVDLVPAVPLKRFDGTPLQASDIQSGHFYAARFNATTTQFEITSPIMVTVTGAITYAAPTALAGMTAVAGSAATVMRSDAAPAINPAINPTWTGTHIFNNAPTVPAQSFAYSKIQNVSATSRVLGRVTAGAGTIEELTGTQTIGLLLGESPTWTGTHTFNIAPVVPAQSFSYSKIQNVSATSRILGRITAGAGTLEELTGTQATTLLDTFTTSLKGLVPASGGGTANFLRADGTFAAPTYLPVISGTTALNISAIAVGQVAVVTKQSNTNRASTTTLAVDPDLQVTNVPVGYYEVRALLNFTDGGGGSKYQMSRSASGISTADALIGMQQNGNVYVGANPQTQTTATPAVVYGTSVSPSAIAVFWAQNSSNVANTTMQNGSTLIVRRLA